VTRTQHRDVDVARRGDALVSDAVHIELGDDVLPGGGDPVRARRRDARHHFAIAHERALFRDRLAEPFGTNAAADRRKRLA
jgi:hypothetical protein